MSDYIIENELKEKGYKLIAGVDEAGRKSLQVYLQCVILPDGLVDIT